jgi:NRPS condensation-like uncharacterized protein
MKRKMLFFERFMYIDGVMPIHCVMTARIRGSIDPGNLRTALARLQARHALLRARVVEEEGEPYFVIEDEAAAIPILTLERKGDDDWRAMTVAQWREPFDMGRGPLLRLVWIRSEQASDLMLVAHHCICDGGSVVTLIRELLQCTDQPETELTPYTSYASLEDLVPPEILSDPRIVRRVGRRAFFYKLLLSVLARKTAPLPYGDPYVLYWKAGMEELAGLNRRCSAEATTVYAALCVAFLQAFRDVQGKRAKNRIMCPVSIRRLLRSIKSDMLFAFAPTIQLSLPKQRDEDFWTLARTMKQSIAKEIDGMQPYEDLMLGARMRSSVPHIVDFLRSSRGGHDVAFSNMGRLKIPAKYDHFVVEALIGATISVPWRNTNTLIATNYLGAMELGFISNERFLPQQEAQAIQQRAIQIVKDAMAQAAG